MKRRAVAVALGLAVLAGVAGCAAPDAAPGPPPAGVDVEFAQLRSDVAARQAQVRIINASDETLEVGDVTVVDPRFDGAATRVIAGRTSTVPAGSTVDVRVQLPPMACGSDDLAEDVTTVQLVLGYPDRDVAPAPAPVEAPLPDPLDVLGPLHERECRAQALAGAASVSFSAFRPSGPGAPAALELTVAPTGEGTAEITGIQTTNLLTFGQSASGAVDEYPLAVAVGEGDADPTVIELPLVPLRCDPHAVQEDKRGTIFDLAIAVDGVPGEIELAADEDMRGAILAWVADWCQFGG
ncbi:hypothetical protein JOD63_003179 [Microbacterium terrae]|uniref:Lipoprotein n=1 Tax=Microbacterium terrae TaxID=69369 RepID=A0A0M2H0X9_9MICO|nr:hypothetical protein [Microbacterium terrae]KJL40068.1 hypothetical protein RS81_01657 [Microbacterium terrae]MBP1079211.1 hypothetical protein [Microbacterium terrae]GLJ98611.1 hypothetical protein GCM10017594_18080 [Microbacterium terrae]